MNLASLVRALEFSSYVNTISTLWHPLFLSKVMIHHGCRAQRFPLKHDLQQWKVENTKRLRKMGKPVMNKMQPLN